MIHVYTGNGKGKTTAALGLCLRAIGAGMRVYIMQFMKSLAYSEQAVLKSFGTHLVNLHTTGKPFFVAPEGTMSEAEREKWGDDVEVFPAGNPPAEYAALLSRGLSEVTQSMTAGNYHMIILDEINVALHFGLISRHQMETLLACLPKDVELICTGRYAPDWLIEQADLVTEMTEVKHYYTRGIEARRGIEN